MSIHRNSQKSLQEVRNSGLFSAQQECMLQELIEHGPGTNRELDARIGHGGRSWHPVLHHLAKTGAVTVTHSRKCTVSGRTAMVYEWAGLATVQPVVATEKPSDEKIQFFLDELVVLVESSTHTPSADFKSVQSWLYERYWKD